MSIAIVRLLFLLGITMFPFDHLNNHIYKPLYYVCGSVSLLLQILCPTMMYNNECYIKLYWVANVSIEMYENNFLAI